MCPFGPIASFQVFRAKRHRHYLDLTEDLPSASGLIPTWKICQHTYFESQVGLDDILIKSNKHISCCEYLSKSRVLLPLQRIYAADLIRSDTKSDTELV